MVLIQRKKTLCLELTINDRSCQTTESFSGLEIVSNFRLVTLRVALTNVDLLNSNHSLAFLSVIDQSIVGLGIHERLKERKDLIYRIIILQRKKFFRN